MTQAERRRQLRLQRRYETLRQLWRFVVFTGVAVGLGYGLLRHGWVLRGPDQVELIGSRQVQRDQLIQAADLRFPLPLLTLQPNRLAAQLSAALPVEQVQVVQEVQWDQVGVPVAVQQRFVKLRRPARQLDDGAAAVRGSGGTARRRPFHLDGQGLAAPVPPGPGPAAHPPPPVRGCRAADPF